MDGGERSQFQSVRDLFKARTKAILIDELRDEVNHFLLSAS